MPQGRATISANLLIRKAIPKPTPGERARRRHLGADKLWGRRWRNTLQGVAPILAPRNIIDIGPNALSPDSSRSCCAGLCKTKTSFHSFIVKWNNIFVFESLAQHERELSGDGALGPISIILRGARMGATSVAEREWGIPRGNIVRRKRRLLEQYSGQLNRQTSKRGSEKMSQVQYQGMP